MLLVQGHSDCQGVDNGEEKTYIPKGMEIHQQLETNVTMNI